MACGANGAWYIRDADVSCKGRILWCSADFADLAAHLVASPPCATNIADFFIRSMGKTMASDSEADKIKVRSRPGARKQVAAGSVWVVTGLGVQEFRDGRWRELTDRQLRNTLERWIQDMIPGLQGPAMQGVIADPPRAAHQVRRGRLQPAPDPRVRQGNVLQPARLEVGSNLQPLRCDACYVT